MRKLSFVIFMVVAYLSLARSQNDAVRQAPRLLKGSEHGVGRMIPDLSFVDLNGKLSRLSDWKSKRAVVVALTSTSCPLSQKYAPTLAKLEDEYRDRGVAFVFVNAMAADRADDCKVAVRQHGFDGTYARDDGTIAKALGALTTTDAFVLDSARTLVYRGAVDDQYGLGYAVETPRQRYLRSALDALLAARQPEIAATWAPGCALDLAKLSSRPLGQPQPTKITYHNTVERLMQSHCVECHRAGGVAPFALDTPAQVVARAAMIRSVVERGAMPPWFAAPCAPGEETPWRNDRSLSAQDKTDLVAWLASDRPLGDAADAPLPRVWPQEWSIGKPDAVFPLPSPISVKATGTMPYQHSIIRTNFTETKWLQKIEIKPGAREVVHHVLAFVVRGNLRDLLAGGGANRARDMIDERTGFFAAYAPGNGAWVFPEGYARELPPGAAIVLQIHYTPNGTATQDHTRIGFIFARQKPQQVTRVAAVANGRISIPPNEANHVERGARRVPNDLQLLAFMPHTHLRGKAFKYELVTADGARRTLLDVPRYDFNWQLTYRLAEPIEVKAGSRLEVTVVYDNSKDNPANPDPNRTVRWGPQTYDEMLLGYFEYTTTSAADLASE